jgi:hypothetical protein
VSYAQFVTEDRRLAALRFLADDADYTINDSVLEKALSAVGHAASRADFRADLSWMEGQTLVTVRREFDGRVWVVTLTNRGLDVARGLATHPGVARPSPVI